MSRAGWRAAPALFAVGIALPLWADSRAVDAGAALFHARAPATVWGLSLLVVPFLALGAWLRQPVLLAAAALAAGGAVSNGIALAAWPQGVPDYWELAPPGLLFNGGDLVIWTGAAAALLAAAGAALDHLRRGGSLLDDASALRGR